MKALSLSGNIREFLSVLPITCRVASVQSLFIRDSILFSSPLLFSSDYGKYLSSYTFGVVVASAFLARTKLLSRFLHLQTVIVLTLIAITGYGFLICSSSNKLILFATFFLLGTVGVSLDILSRLFYGRFFESQREMQPKASASASVFQVFGTLGAYFICGLSITYFPNYTWHVCLGVSTLSLAIAIYSE